MFPSLGIDTWKEETLSDLVEKILNIAPRLLILIDGKGGCGKSSFAKKLADVLNANVVAVDDVGWWADPIQWDGEMTDGIITPWLNGENISYRPSGWVKKGREGSIDVDSGRALIIEGNGACRKTLRKFASYSVWVDTEPDIARERGLQRDIANGENGGTIESITEFWDFWDSIYDPFFLEEESWKHVDIILSGFHSDADYNTLYTTSP